MKEQLRASGGRSFRPCVRRANREGAPALESWLGRWCECRIWRSEVRASVRRRNELTMLLKAADSHLQVQC